MKLLINEAILASQLRMDKDTVLRTIQSLQRFADKGNDGAKNKILELQEKYKDLLKD